MNKQQLASKIWSGANALRGKVSADSYKDYMLGFTFYKYISYKEEKYLIENLYFEREDIKKLNEDDYDTVENCKKNLGYFIEYKNLFSTWIDKENKSDFQIRDVRIALSAFNNNIGKNYKKVYDGIFNTLEKGIDNLGTDDTARTKAALKLFEIIKEIPTDGNQDYDVLGFVYEFLLKNFAANAGKAGEFYTPHEASVLMSEIVAEHLKDKEQISIYDPTSGSGSLLINIGQTIAKHMSEKNKIKYYAQELIENTYNLTRMNLIMRDILPSNIVVRNGDTLLDDWPFFEENDKEKTYEFIKVDAAISNPPYSQAWNIEKADVDPRFAEYGIAPKSKADYAFLLHNLYHLENDGIMTIVLPHGVLFRGGDEKIIRENLVDKDKIDTIIGLPANMFFGTGIPTIIMILKKNRKENNILFIDASKGFEKDGNKNRLRDKDIRKILDVIFERKTVEKFSRVIEKKEIIENDYNLNIPRYVDSCDKDEYHDIYASMFGGIPNYEIDELNDYWNIFKGLKEKIFVSSNIPYSTVTEEELNTLINQNEEVCDFKLNYMQSIAKFKEILKAELVNDIENINIYRKKELLVEKLREIMSEVSGIDFYDAYQIFENCWQDISMDLEIIQKDGKDAVNKVDPNMIYKKNTKTKEIEEVQDGYVGRILSYDLIQNEYFKTEKENIEELQDKLTESDSNKKALLEKMDPNDKAQILKDDSEDINSKELKKVISKIKAEVKKGAEFDEDSYEDLILNISRENDEISKNKKIIKELKNTIEKETKEKIENLNNEESIKMLEIKWIDSMCNDLEKLSNDYINEFIKQINYLEKKYETSYIENDTQINKLEKELSVQLSELKYEDEFDMKGINEFISLLNGDNNG